jgi:ectoine hydroxylase-related dioxygenase (phytanoyl-CoA dioxygenase family)
MHLTLHQIDQYHETGYLFTEKVFSDHEIDRVTAAVAEDCREASPARIMEKDGVHVRTIFGSHARNDILRDLSRHPRVLEPARQLIGDAVYIHQFKVNTKSAFAGDVWQWHQDYIYWLREDGMARAEALTAAIFLDDVTEFNGPLLIVPRSQRLGVIETEARETAPDWHATVIADLKYALGPDTMKDVVRREGIVAPKGRRGAVLYFHCNVVHGSVPNMSPIDRRVLFISYNSVTNPLDERPNPRPWFMACRCYDPLTPVDDHVLRPEEQKEELDPCRSEWTGPARA